MIIIVFYDSRGRRAKANVNYIPDSEVQVIEQSRRSPRRSPRKHPSSEYEITIFGNNTLTLLYTLTL